MKISKNTIVLTFILLISASNALSQDIPVLRRVDRVRLAEAFRLADKLGDDLWSGWNKAPFAVLLVTRDTEFLIRHPRPTEDFRKIEYDALLKSDVYFRERKFPPDYLATFPAVGGISTIVVGQAENTTSKTSTPWVVTLMHEHFHQLQDSQPNFFKETEALNLSRGDQSGMWMLNYSFPYTTPEVSEQFSVLARALIEAMEATTPEIFSSKLTAYLKARDAVKKMLSADDYRYMSFQLWKEGIARYTEDRVAHWAASKYQPSREFRELKDFITFAAAAEKVRAGIMHELSTMKLPEYKRVVFYPLGAGEGLLLDRANAKWRNRYFVQKFDNESYFKEY
jgi:hypothetical protein